MKPKKLPADLQEWVEARRRHRLSHSQVQMARELGLNPRKLGKIDNHDQEPWKLPLPQFIEELYQKRFGKTAPDNVLSIEEKFQLRVAKQAERKAARATAKNEIHQPSETDTEASPSSDDVPF